MRAQRQTKTFRRQRAADMKKAADLYKVRVSDESNLGDLAQMSYILANLVMIDSDSRMHEQSRRLFDIARELEEAAR